MKAAGIALTVIGVILFASAIGVFFAGIWTHNCYGCTAGDSERLLFTAAFAGFFGVAAIGTGLAIWGEE